MSLLPTAGAFGPGKVCVALTLSGNRNRMEKLSTC